MRRIKPFISTKSLAIRVPCERLTELLRSVRELFPEREPFTPGNEFLTQTSGAQADNLKMVYTVLGDENIVSQRRRVPGEMVVKYLYAFGIRAAAQIARSRVPQWIGFEQVDLIPCAMQGPGEKARAAAYLDEAPVRRHAKCLQEPHDRREFGRRGEVIEISVAAGQKKE